MRNQIQSFIMETICMVGMAPMPLHWCIFYKKQCSKRKKHFIFQLPYIKIEMKRLENF